LLACEHLDGIDWSWLSIGGCMTKSPPSGTKTGRNPTDRGKQGVKRNQLTDANGLPLSLVVAAANMHDIKRLQIHSMPFRQAVRVKSQALPGQRLRSRLAENLSAESPLRAAHQSRKEESDASKIMEFKAHRWVVERKHSWMNRFRRV
jgi:transposase